VTVPSPETLARHSGWCGLCHLRIRKGEDFVSKLGRRWVHSLCAAEVRRVRDEHAEEDAA
jgi:hypothetical protein